MLNIYLVPKKQVSYVPSESQIRRWHTELQGSSLAQCLNEGLEDMYKSFEQSSTLTLEFASDLNTHHLYDEDAHEALLPVELSFESMSLNVALHASLLPLDELEFEASCSYCADPISEQDLDLAIAKLDIFPLSKVQVSCISCQNEWPLKSLQFEPEMNFAKSWICIQQSASTRLNPVVIKAWEKSLGCELLQLDAQFEDNEHERWIHDQSPSSYAFQNSSAIGAQGRKDYRQSRWQKKQKGKIRNKKKTKNQGRWQKL